MPPLKLTKAKQKKVRARVKKEKIQPVRVFFKRGSFRGKEGTIYLTTPDEINGVVEVDGDDTLYVIPTVDFIVMKE